MHCIQLYVLHLCTTISEWGCDTTVTVIHMSDVSLGGGVMKTDVIRLHCNSMRLLLYTIAGHTVMRLKCHFRKRMQLHPLLTSQVGQSVLESTKWVKEQNGSSLSTQGHGVSREPCMHGSFFIPRHDICHLKK